MLLFQKIFLILLCWVNYSVLANTIKYELIDKIVVTVEKDVVTQSEIEKETKKVLNGNDINNIDNLTLKKIKSDVTKRLIERKLIFQHAELTNINISEPEIDQVLDNIIKNNNITIETLKEDLKKNNSNLLEFRDDLKFQIILQKIKDREISPQINVSSYEVASWLKKNQEQNTEYHLFHTLIKHDKPNKEEIIGIITKGGKDNFKKLTAQYSDGPNAEELGDLGWMKIENIPTIFQEFILKAKIGDISKPIESSNGFHILFLEDYRGNKNSKPIFIKQLKFQQILLKFNTLNSDDDLEKKLSLIKAKIENGLTFSEAVKLYSDDQFNIDPDNLKWINFNNLLPQFKKNINFVESKNILGPFKTELGWHLVKIYEHRESDITNETEKEKAKIEIIKKKAEIKFKDWLDGLYKNSKITYLDKN